jgi:hypothetical protein
VLLLEIFSYHNLQVFITIHIYFISAFKAIRIRYTKNETVWNKNFYIKAQTKMSVSTSITIQCSLGLYTSRLN